MSRLIQYSAVDPQAIFSNTCDADIIEKELHKIGVRFERWHSEQSFAADIAPMQVLDIFAKDVERIKIENGFQFLYHTEVHETVNSSL